MSDHSVFLIEKLKLIARKQLEDRIEQHLKDQFYHKWLPKVLDDVKNNLLIDLVSDENEMRLIIKLNKPNEEK